MCLISTACRGAVSIRNLPLLGGNLVSAPTVFAVRQAKDVLVEHNANQLTVAVGLKFV
jgi:hypothetical protein